MTRLFNRRLLTFTISLCIGNPLIASAMEPFIARDIRVDGLQRIAPGTVFTYLPISRGDSVNDDTAADAIRALYHTGFFDDIALQRQGDILVIDVKERPSISSLTVTGNKDIKTDELLKGLTDIGLSEGSPFDHLSLDRVTQELMRQYNNRGKYNVQITPTLKTLDRNRVAISIAINEGKAAKIQSVNLIGTHRFDNRDILDNWESKPHRWNSWYTRSDQYAKEKLSGDLEKLNAWYLDRGYADFSLDSTQVTIDQTKRDMFITASVTEGEQYRLSAIDVTGQLILPREHIDRLVIPKVGAIFSRILIEKSCDAITNALANIGYAFAKVNPIPTPDRDKHTVAIEFQVVPGPRVRVHQIVFRGNTRTADEVVRREMRQFENSWYSQAAIDRSKIRLQRLGFFEKVSVEIKPVAATNDQVDAVFTVKETSSGSFQIGLGYSRSYGLTTSAQLSENNFLGSGNRIALDAAHSTYQDRYSFSYTNPFFTDDGVSLGYSLGYQKLNYSNFNAAQYNSKRVFGQSIFGVPITENDTLSLMLGVDSNQITTYPGYTPQSIIDYINAVGKHTFHAWRTELGWARDTRNDFLMPTHGLYQRIGAEITLPGSTVSYYKLNYQFSNYWSPVAAVTLNTRMEVGYGDGYGKARSHRSIDADGSRRTLTASGLPFFENFYAGGTNSVRGFEDNTLGPRSQATTVYEQGQPLGGAFKTVGAVELFFPKLFNTPTARLSAFYDIGNVFSRPSAFHTRQLRSSAGIALMWRAPIGPIAISYAFPIRHQQGDLIERLQFTFGGQF